MIILGVDPGSAITGYAIIKKQRESKNCLAVIDFGCIITEPSLSAGERLKKIHKEITKLIKKYRPNLMSVESLYFFKNLKTVMPVSQTRGVILLAAAQEKIPVCDITPLQVKMSIVGYGRAEKKQVQEMLKKQFDLDHLDLKKNYRKKDDAFDALGLAVCASIKNF